VIGSRPVNTGREHWCLKMTPGVDQLFGAAAAADDDDDDDDGD